MAPMEGPVRTGNRFKSSDDPVERLRSAHFDHAAFCAEPYLSETPGQRILRAFELIEFGERLRRGMK